jgi:hypothetical protein
MKKHVQRILKENGQGNLFTDDRYKAMLNIMKVAVRFDKQLETFLSLDPLNKAQFIADHIIKYSTK